MPERPDTPSPDQPTPRAPKSPGHGARMRRLRTATAGAICVAIAVGIAQLAGIVAVLPGDGAASEGPAGPPATVTWAAAQLAGSNVGGTSAGTRLTERPTVVADVLAPGQGGALRLTHPARVLVTAVVRASTIGGKPTPGTCTVLVGAGRASRTVASADLDVALASQPGTTGIGAASSRVELPLVGVVDLGAGSWNARVECVGDGDVASSASLSLQAVRATDAADASWTSERLRGRAVALHAKARRVAYSKGSVRTARRNDATLATGAVTVTVQRPGAAARCDLQRIRSGRATTLASAALTSATTATLAPGSRVSLVLDGSGAKVGSGRWHVGISCRGSGTMVTRTSAFAAAVPAASAARSGAAARATATSPSAALGVARASRHRTTLGRAARVVAQSGHSGRSGTMHLARESRVVISGIVPVRTTSDSGIATCTLVRIGSDRSSLPLDVAWTGGARTGAVAGSGALALHAAALVPAGNWRWQARCSGHGASVAGATVGALAVS